MSCPRLIEVTNREGWLKLKALLEASGKTTSPFYARACAIAQGLPDPGDDPFSSRQHANTHH